MKVLYWILRPIIVFIFRLLFPYTIIGKKKTDGTYPCVIICNHLSNADAFMVGTCFKKKIFFYGKKEWFKNKLVGGFLKIIGGVPIDRDATDLNAIKTGFKILKDGSSLAIFPEGTRNKTKENLLPIKGGVGMIACRAKMDVLPIWIYQKGKMFRRNYIYVGDKFSLEEFYGKKDKSEEITAKITEKMLLTRQQTIDYLKSKKKIKEVVS